MQHFVPSSSLRMYIFLTLLPNALKAGRNETKQFMVSYRRKLLASSL